MGAIYNLLESYYNKCLELGVKDERDFLDGVTDEVVIKLDESTDVGLIIGITVLIVVAAAIVIVFVSTRVSQQRRGMSNDLVLALETGPALL